MTGAVRFIQLYTLYLYAGQSGIVPVWGNWGQGGRGKIGGSRKASPYFRLPVRMLCAYAAAAVVDKEPGVPYVVNTFDTRNGL